MSSSDTPSFHHARRRLVALSGLAAAAVTASGTPGRAEGSGAQRSAKGLGMPWEDEYGYAQSVKVGDTIHLSGQLSHNDSGEIVAPAPIDADGKVADFSNMGAQMEQTYANCAKLLAQYGLTMENVVQEVIYVLDMDAAFKVAGPVRKKAFGSQKPAVASTILVTPRLAFPSQLIEISMIAVA